MRLLGPESYASVFEPLTGKRVGYVRPLGNIGDWLIELATIQLFGVYGIDWKLQDADGPAEVDVIAFGGGGNMGSFYEGNWKLREKCLRLGLPVTILPQSFLSREDRPFARVYVRETASFEYCCEGATLAPDLALGLSYEPYAKPSKETGVFLRRDVEGLFCRRWNRDPDRMCKTPCDYLELAACYRQIITDRLHFAISGLIVGCETTLLPNSYHKNLSMYETWLRQLGCRFAHSATDAVARRTRKGARNEWHCR